MFLAGLGVGPTFSVFTIVIQNAVPFRQMGVATSNLTFFRQIGGSVALAFVGTIFASTFQDDLIPQMSAAGVPQQVIAGFQQAVAAGAVDFNQLTGVGDIGAAITASFPQLAPVVPAIVEGIHGAFSLAVGQTFWLGVLGSAVAVLAAVAIKELPLRASNAAPIPTEAIRDGGPATDGAPAQRNAQPSLD
jgi:hypothetical protein